MLERRALPPQARRILDLARSDRVAATRAMGELPIDAQVALVCEAPVARRAELLGLAPQPEQLVPRLPEAELCFALKSLGIADGSWLLEFATPEQIVACLDLDAWSGSAPDRATLDAWLDALADTSPETFLRAIRALDPELLVWFLKSRIEVFPRPDDADSWSPPDGGQTLENQFYFCPLAEGDDLASVVRLLRLLFEREYWTYFRAMQGVLYELDSDNEEWALRWRTGRLQDLGFPPWEEAMSVYRFLRPAERALLPERGLALAVGSWPLPVWIPGLPASADAPNALFRAVAQLDGEERRALFYAFVALANKVAVADRMPLSDAESTPRAIAKASRFASDGLEYVARERGQPPAEVLRRVPIERLFRVGANLDPESAKP